MFRWIKEDKNDKKKKKEKKKKDGELSKDDLKRLDEVSHSFLSYSNFEVSGEEDKASNSSGSLSSLSHSTSPLSPSKVPPPVPKKPRFLTKSPSSIKSNSNTSPQGSASLTTEMMSIMEQISGKSLSHQPSSQTSSTSSSSIHTLTFDGHPGEQPGIGHSWKPCACETTEKVLPSKPPRARVLTIHRQTNGDFGFSLRRAILVDPRSTSESGENKQTIIFAEPSGILGQNNETGLLPGDRLLEVNDVSVESKSKEEIIELIKNSKNSLKLKVQTVPELSELTYCAANNATDEPDFTPSLQGKPEEQLQEALTWLHNDAAWLVHRHGITACKVLQKTSEGKTKIYVPTLHKEMEADDEDIEKANSPQFDRTLDLVQLVHLNESSVLHTLSHRFASSLIFTFASPGLLLTLNPLRPLALYSEKVMKLYRSCYYLNVGGGVEGGSVPPHIYAQAHRAYHQALTTRRNQSLVLLGRSGSGKSSALRHILHYLAFAASAGSTRSNFLLTVDKANAIITLLEAFGNSRTASNTNATRYIHLFTLDLDHSGQIISSSIQTHLLEKSRVSRRPEGEPNFHVFYHLLAGVDPQLRKELLLENTSELCLFMTPLQKAEDKQKASVYWSYILAAMKTLDFKEQEVKAILHVLAAIYHLGVAGATRNGSGRGQFLRPQSAQRAASLLGTTVEELTKGVFPTDYIGFSGKLSPKSGGDGAEIIESLQAMAAGLYGEVFNVVVSLINRCLGGSSGRVSSSIHILDLPGIQNPSSTNPRSSGASLEDFCYNYCNEKLHDFFFDSSYKNLHHLYTQENVSWPLEEVAASSPLSSILDSPQMASNKGLLCLMDEESLYASSERSFIDKIFSHYNSKDEAEIGQWIQHQGYHMMIHHAGGTNAVTYYTSNWHAHCREHPTSRYAAALLQDSTIDSISQLFVWSGRSGGSSSSQTTSSFSGANPGAGDSSLRNSSVHRRRSQSTATGTKRRSLPLQAKVVMDALLEVLYHSNPHFILFFLPHHSAGLNLAIDSDDQVNLPLLRSQLRGFQLLDVLRLYKQGFPEHMPYDSFRHKFELLVPVELRESAVLDQQEAVSRLTQLLDLDPSSYRLGNTQILMRAGVLASLEARRNHKMSEVVVRLQSVCRGHLARSRLERLRLQDTAIKVIQRNVRKMAAIHAWPWWKLLSRVRPLLNVHKTEEELRARTEEAEALRAKVARLEQESVDLRHQNDKLEAKVSELWTELGEEQAAAGRAASMLDAETADRRRLEREIADLQTKYSQLQELSKLEVDGLHRSNELNGDLSDIEDDEAMTSLYKSKYERAMRELETTKRRLQQQHEEEMEQQVMMKKASDKKLYEAQEDLDEERKVTAQWKRKAQKLTAELQDLRLVLEEHMVRNAELEKRQRKFDADLNANMEELKKERLARERLEREREAVAAEKYSLEQELHTAKLDLDIYTEKVALLTREIEELTLTSRGEEEVTQLKRSKQELERRLAEAEEELEEQAAQVTLLEQAKLRLEMSLEKARQEHRREMASRDDEIDELRATYTKKLKNLESQLEAEQEERHQAVKQRHELEHRVAELQEAQQHDHSRGETERRLRRDLKRTRALLADAQLMLERQRDGQASKSLIRQLKNQVEDAEFAKAAALKSRQGAELELEELQSQLEESQRAKAEAESRVTQLARDRATLSAQLEEAEEDMSELLKKYKNLVHQMSVDQKTIAEQAQQISELEAEKHSLKDQLAEMNHKLEQLSENSEDIHKVHRLEARLREMESRLEMEQMAHSRLEHQISKLKEAGERAREEGEAGRQREQAAKDTARRLQRQLREAKEECAAAQHRETEAIQKLQQMESELSRTETDLQTTRNDLRLACQRIQDLQAALEDDLDSGTDVPDSDDSDSSASSGLASSSRLTSSRLSSRHSSRRSSLLLLRTPSQEFPSRVEAVNLEETASSEV